MFELKLFICIKMDLALNNLKWLICHKTKPKLLRIVYFGFNVIGPKGVVLCCNLKSYYNKLYSFEFFPPVLADSLPLEFE